MALRIRETYWDQGVESAAKVSPYLAFFAGLMLRSMGGPKGTVTFMMALGAIMYFGGEAYVSRRPERLIRRARRRFLLEKPDSLG